jgi:hypothetical protein
VVLTLAALLIGISGFYGLQSSNNAIKTVYEDRLVCVGQLDEMMVLVLRNQLLVAQSLAESPEKVAKNIKAVEANKAQMNKVWSHYMETYLTEEEKVLAKQFYDARAVYTAQALEPLIGKLKANDIVGAGTLLTGN